MILYEMSDAELAREIKNTRRYLRLLGHEKRYRRLPPLPAAVASTDTHPEIPAPSTARPEQSSGSELKVDFDRFTGKGRKR